MAETDQTKICPLCVEAIKAAAKVCPHCRSRLKTQKGLLVGVLKIAGIMVLVYGPILLAAWWVRDLKQPGQSFEPYRDNIILISMENSLTLAYNFSPMSLFSHIRNQPFACEHWPTNPIMPAPVTKFLCGRPKIFGVGLE